MARIYDNIEVKFTEGLRGIISNTGTQRVDFCVGYFNLRGWNLVVDQIDALPGGYVEEGDDETFRVCRLLIGMHRPDEDLLRNYYSHKEQKADAKYLQQCKLKIAADFRKQLILGLPTSDDESTLRRLSAQMKEGKVCVKLYVREPLHAKLYLAHRPDDNFNKIQAIMGSSNLTFSGLTKQGELNAEFGDSDSAQKLSDWFDERWNDRYCIDITHELIEIIDNSWAGENEIPPYYIYLKTAYHLSRDAREGISEYALTHEFEKELFDFQQTAVKIATKHINDSRRNGAMIGDVVGLGKTITACAIAKIFETTYAGSTLIICPANLKNMWHKYINKYDLKADVKSIAEKFKVEEMRFYRLIIVDESHNLRNADGERYRRIKKLIEYQNSKVLLLTATPYNKHFKDLLNQLRLFVSDDQDLGMRPEEYVRAFADGERGFHKQHSDVHIRSLKAFEHSTSEDDWNELMKLFLVRRTRTFIKENYAKTDPKNGRKYLEFPDGTKSYFPDRKPIAIKFATEQGDQYSRLYSEEMLKKIESLSLPRYGLSNYFDEHNKFTLTSDESRIMENLSRAGKRMMGFCKSTMYKRVDSSGLAFLLTVYRHILRNAVYMYAIDNNLPIPIGDENELPEEYTDDADSTDELLDYGSDDTNIRYGDTIAFPQDINAYMASAKAHYTNISSPANQHKCAWISSKLFMRTLRTDLDNDCRLLIDMLAFCGDWNPSSDPKLNELEKLLTTTHKNDKVIVFTQFSDTANYIYRQLKKRGITDIDWVSGKSEDPLQSVSLFSPKSNGINYLEQQTRVLIATDVLSEGQNLQDAHVIASFDLPWAIIRLIQRAGRVDRIGQKAEQIFCYSFFPADGVEQIIKLRSRLNERINQNASIVGSDEVFFEGNEQNLKDMYNEKSGVLDDGDDGDVDLSSKAYQIWKNATEANPQLKTIIPALDNVIYSTKTDSNVHADGVITYAKTHNDFDILTWMDANGNIVSQSQGRILNALSCSADTPAAEPLANHHQLVANAVENIATESTSVSGILGNRLSVRYRVVMALDAYCQQPNNLLLDDDKRNTLRLIIDEIYNNQLLESARSGLNRVLRTRNDDSLAEYVIDLYEKQALCVPNNNTERSKTPSIICSMGLRSNP